ncbi:hypothetical protein V6N12_030596 [Hibiscus sabdariffa]|uniref:USP domain-containing protein n=1 Tax=Hibiscus sabdariffa TaxID=183260 RepID=A0ABR1ZMI7_9ROSI
MIYMGAILCTRISHRYKFPLPRDLDRDLGKYSSPEADSSVRNLYMLHSFFIHSGGVHGGHYYAYIRPTRSDQWHYVYSLHMPGLPRSPGW